MNLRSYRRHIYDWLVSHWFVSALIASAPAFVFTFIEIFGVNFGLVNNNGAIVDGVYWFLIFIFVVSVVYTFSLAWLNSYDIQIKQNGQFVLSRIRESLDAIKDTKLRRFTNYISNNHGNQG